MRQRPRRAGAGKTRRDDLKTIQELNENARRQEDRQHEWKVWEREIKSHAEASAESLECVCKLIKRSLEQGDSDESLEELRRDVDLFARSAARHGFLKAVLNDVSSDSPSSFFRDTSGLLSVFMEGLKQDDERVRASSINEIGKIAASSDKARQILLRVYDRSSEWEQEIAARFLAQVAPGTPRLDQVLTRALEKWERNLRKVLLDPQFDVDSMADWLQSLTESMTRLRGPHAQAIAVLSRVLSMGDLSPLVRLYAADALWKLGGSCDTAAHALVDWLELVQTDSNLKYCDLAHHLLWELGARASAVAPRLESLLHSWTGDGRWKGRFTRLLKRLRRKPIR